ncbi:hypothetical protein LXM94_13345 [Rhizobium sp. TRM95111]|nr:hypothetical protein [Rhizobium alarense]MCF3640957.1 hypothetical protein [Rhizobium alarense]
MSSNFFRAAAQRFVEARQRQADRLIAQALAGYDEETLKRLGRSMQSTRR